MSIDVERELRLAMQDLTADLHASPDLLDRVRPKPRRRVPSLRVATAMATAAAVVVAGAVVGTHVGGGNNTVSVAATFADWGPARGDLAHDPATLQAIDAEWAHPTGREADIAGFDPVHGDRPLQLLWAGQTADGPAAYAVQHTTDPRTPWVYGVFIPDSDRTLKLYYRMTLDPTDPGAAWQPHPWGFSFASSRTPHSVVVLPADPRDPIEISFRHTTGADGRVAPQWADVQAVDGAAVIDIPAGGSVWDTVVRIGADDRPLFAGGVSLIPSTDGAPPPRNAFGLWCNGCNVGSGGDLGEGERAWKAWTERHAPSWYPTYEATWTVGVYLDGGGEVLARQLWLPGEPAHTVVGVTRRGGAFKEIVVDEQTDPLRRPVVAVRVPPANGWLVGAGPDAVVTGWRTDGGAWHAVPSKKALLVPTTATSIELRMTVKGREVVVSRG